MILAEYVPVTGTSIMYLSSFLKANICKITFEAVSMANLLLRASNLLLRSGNSYLNAAACISRPRAYLELGEFAPKVP